MATIRNLTAGDIELNDLGGVTVEALSDYNLNEESQNDINNSIDLNNAITNGVIVYLDVAGNPLTTQESLNVQSSALTPAIFVQKTGINITNTPHQVLNFVSTGTSISDNADGSVNISIDSDSSIWGNITGALSNQLDLQTALDNKEPANVNIQAHISDTTIHFTQAAISITESQISDLQSYLIIETDPVFIAQKGAANGVATLGADSKIPSSQLPAIVISNTFVVASQAAMLALTAQTGDIAVRTDENKTYILKGIDATLLTDWQVMLTPTDSILSVNGQTGTVVLTTSDISEGTNLYYTDTRVSANTDVAAGTTHIADGSIHYAQSAISITESQISDLGAYEPAFSKNTGFNLNLGTTAGTVSEGNHTHTMIDITDSTWISNITGQSIKNLSDVNSSMTPSDSQVLTYNGTNNEWEAQSSSGGGAPVICFRHNGSVTQTLTSSFSTINIATSVRTDSTHYSYSSNQITILQSGWYKVTYSVTFDSTGGGMGGSRFDTQTQLENNNIAISGSTLYTSGYNSQSNTSTGIIWLNAAANDVIRIRSKEISGAAVTETNGCRITIEFYG